MSSGSVRLCWCIFSSLLVICVSKIRCGIHARYVKCDYKQRGLSNFVPKALSYSSSAREGTLETKFRFSSSTVRVQYSSNSPVRKPVTMELHWRLHGRPLQRNHSYLCVDLFARSMGKFNNLAIFIQGSYLYGRLDFANSIFFVSVVFGQRQTWPIYFKYRLLITFLPLLARKVLLLLFLIFIVLPPPPPPHFF